MFRFTPEMEPVLFSGTSVNIWEVTLCQFSEDGNLFTAVRTIRPHIIVLLGGVGYAQVSCA
jgi:hypothetical protein